MQTSDELAPFEPDGALLGPYFEGLTEGRVRMQRCASCGQLQLPPRRRCHRCGGGAFDWVDASGRAEVWAVSVFYKPYLPEFRDRVPYNVAIVRLEEGPRLLSNVVGVDDDNIEAGMPLVAETAVADDGTPLVRFRPAQRAQAAGD